MRLDRSIWPIGENPTLADFINTEGGQITFSQLQDFAQDTAEDYPPGLDIFDILETGRQLGHLTIDYKEQLIISNSPKQS